MEPAEWQELEDEAPNEFQRTDGETNQVLIEVQSVGLHSGTAKLNEDTLDDDGKNEDDNEPYVVEEVSEHIDLIISDLSRVNEVENLHENKDLEDNGVVKHLLTVLECLHLIGGHWCRLDSLPVCITFWTGFLPFFSAVLAVELLEEILIIHVCCKSSIRPLLVGLFGGEELASVEWVPLLFGVAIFHVINGNGARSPVVLGHHTWDEEDS